MNLVKDRAGLDSANVTYFVFVKKNENTLNI